MKSQAEIYAKMHGDRFLHIEDLRRARDYQAQLADMTAQHVAIADVNAQILALIMESASRYSAGSVTRAALDSLALGVREVIDRDPQPL